MFERQRIIEDQVNLEAAREYVRNNTVNTVDGRKCVDGRYRKDERNGMIARPGGDFGYVMALMAVNKKLNLGLTAEQCFNKVYDVVTADEEGMFGMHTDQYADPEKEQGEEAHEKSLIGCGHIAKASDEGLCELYDINAADLQGLVAVARERKKQGGKIDLVSLHGDHAERGVFVVSSEAKTIDPFDEPRNIMYFVYDKQRDEAFMKGLVEKLGIDGLTFEEFKKASDKQLQATLGVLAGGLPLYNVDFQKQEPVEMVGKVERLKK